MPPSEIPPPKDITKPEYRVHRNNRPRSNLFAELQHYSGPSNYLTQGGSDRRSGDKPTVSTGDHYRLMSGNSSDIPHSSPHQEGLTPANHLDGLRLRVESKQRQLQASQEILVDVEKTLGMTAHKVDELTDWRINTTENALFYIEHYLKRLNDMKEYINDTQDKLAYIRSVITEDIIKDYDKLHLEIENSDNYAVENVFLQAFYGIRMSDLTLDQRKTENVTKNYDRLRLEVGNSDNYTVENIFLPALDDIRISDLAIDQQKSELQARAELQLGKIESSIKMTESVREILKLDNAEPLQQQLREILELDNAELLQQQLADWEKKLWDNEEHLIDAMAQFREILTISESEHDIEQRLLDKIDSGEERLSTAPGDRTALTTADGEIEFAARLKPRLEDHLNTLHAKREELSNVTKTFQTIQSNMKIFDILKAKVEKTPGYTPDTFSVQYMKRYQIGIFLDLHLKYTSEAPKQIDGAIEKTNEALQQITELHNGVELLNRPMADSFFLRQDMRPARATIDIVRRGELPGVYGLIAVRTLLNAQGIEVTDSEGYIAGILGLRRFGEFDLLNLETKLGSLGDRRGLHFRTIEEQDLETALSKGPIAAFLSIHQHRTKAFVVDHIERNPRTRQLDVVVLEPFIPVPYKITVEKFTRVWNKDVILPKDALPNNPQHKAGPVIRREVRPTNDVIFNTIVRGFARYLFGQ